MMYAEQQAEPIHMAEAEYLAFEESSEVRHEYCRGKVFEMTGSSVRHSVITVNVGTQLYTQLKERDYFVTFTLTRLYIASKQSYRYPDVSIFCGEPAYAKNRDDTITNPILIAEVLSPSTELRDRDEKLTEYLRFESLHTYLLISQDRPKVECFVRSEGIGWLYHYVTELTDEITLPEIGCTLTLSRIYQKITFDSPNEA